MTPGHLRSAFVAARRAPALSLVVVALLALGIGANAAVFSVVRAVLLRPLPYEDPDRLVVIWQDLTNRNVKGYPAAPADIADFRKVAAFEDVAGALAYDGSLVQASGAATRVRVASGTVNLLDLLGVRPLLGRGFSAEDGVPFPERLPAPGGQAAVDDEPDERPNTALLSWGAWQSYFAGDADIIGRKLRLGGGPAIVIGVLPRDFRLRLPAARYAEPIDVFLPLRVNWNDPARRAWFLDTVARLVPDATVADAHAQLEAVRQWQWENFPVYSAAGTYHRVEPLHHDLTRQARPAMTALAGAVGLVLLVACVNVASLLLVRAKSRSRELAVRAALGGDRRRLASQLFAENLWLALVGGALGLVLARAGVMGLLRLAPADLPAVGSTGVDAGVAAFALALSMASALLFGTLPALRASRPDLVSSLRGRTPADEPPALRRLLGGLVVAQVALCVVLLISAALLGRSFASLQDVELGFTPDSVVTFRTDLPFARYPELEPVVKRHAELRERFAAMPGVVAVGATSNLPLDGSREQGPYGGERELADGNEGDLRQAYFSAVLPGYFEAMRVPLLAGRLFDASDQETPRDIVIVDRRLAERTFGAENPIGRKIYTKFQVPPGWLEVVGVVESMRIERTYGEEQEAVFVPQRWDGGRTLSWTLRTTTAPDSVLTAARAVVAEVDPEIAFSSPEPMREVVSRAHAPLRFSLVVLSLFGAAALALALVGLYGVLAYAVRSRRHEIGVRLALGAAPRRILGTVLARGLLLVALGLVAGAAAASLVTRLLAAQLVETSPLDAATFATVPACFLLAGALACLLPARRAARVDPLRSLREE